MASAATVARSTRSPPIHARRRPARRARVKADAPVVLVSSPHQNPSPRLCRRSFDKTWLPGVSLTCVPRKRRWETGACIRAVGLDRHRGRPPPTEAYSNVGESRIRPCRSAGPPGGAEWPAQVDLVVGFLPDDK